MSQRTESKKWQPLRQKDANKTKFYTFRNGQVDTFDFNEIKNSKKERDSSLKRVFHIKKSQTLIDAEERKKNQTKLWYYDKNQYQKDVPAREEEIEVNVPEDEVIENRPQTPPFEPEPEDLPIKRERSPILVAPLPKKKEPEPQQPPPPPKQEFKKQEPKPTQKLAPVVVVPPVKASRAIAHVIDTKFNSKSFESINKSMKYYRY